MKHTAKLLFVSIILLFFSCDVNDLEFDKIKSPTYNPSLSLKLGSTSYTIKELVDDIEDEKLEINEGTDFSLTFIYRDTTTFDATSDFVSISTIQNSTNVAGGNSSPPSPVAFSIPVNEVFTFTYDSNDGELLDSAFYSGGTMEFNISSDFQGSFNFTWTIIGTKDVVTGIDLSNTTIGTYTGTTPVTDQFSRPLLGLKSLVTNSGGQNEFNLVLNGTIDIPAGVAVSPGQELTIDVTFRDPTFSAVFGDFGNKTVELANQTIDMQGFEEFGDNGLELNDPKIIIEVDNYYGIGLSSSLSGVKSINNDGSELDLIITNPTAIDTLIEGTLHTNAGGFQTSIVEINKTNTNIDELLNSTPTSMIFPITAEMNPINSVLTTNFITDSSFVEQRTIVEIPLDFKMDGFTREFDFDISDIDIEDATEMTIRIITVNEMPFTGTIDLQFLDASGIVLHEVLNEGIFNSPTQLDGQGRTVTPDESIEDIELNQVAIDAFIQATTVNAILSVQSFDATNNTFVKIFSDYSLEIDLSVSGSFSIQL